jgi:hypothetical protein
MELTKFQIKIKNIDFNLITSEDADKLLNELFEIKDDDVFLTTSSMLIDLVYNYTITTKTINRNVDIIFEDKKLNDYYENGCKAILKRINSI